MPKCLKFEIFKILSTLNFEIIIFFIPFSFYFLLSHFRHFSSFYNLFVGLLHNSFDPSFFFYFYGLMLNASRWKLNLHSVAEANITTNK